MSGDQLDLDEVTRRVRDATELLEQEAHALRRDTAVRGRDTLAAQAIDAAATMVRDDALDLVAEVRRLRVRFRLCDGCDATMVRCNEHIEAGAIKCCPDCKHADAA